MIKDDLFLKLKWNCVNEMCVDSCFVLSRNDIIGISCKPLYSNG